MKKIFFVLLLCVSLSLSAQSSVDGFELQESHAPVLVFQASHGESFLVYVDGSLYLRNPMGRVEVKGLDRSSHDVVVVLHHPANKLVYMPYHPGEKPQAYLVCYTAQEDVLRLLSQHHDGQYESEQYSSQSRWAQQLDHLGDRKDRQVVVIPPALPKPVVVTDEEEMELFGFLRHEDFDAKRLDLVRSALESKWFTSEQIKHLASVFDYDANKVTFLIAAYPHCVDQENYFKVVQVLRFSIDREKVLQSIQQ